MTKLASIDESGSEREQAALSRGVSPRVQPPIDEYAIIGDCRTAALVSKDGSIDWLCLPDFDGPAIFARLLQGNGGGFCSVQPRQALNTSRRYVGQTPVLETTFATADGTVRLMDACILDDTALRPMREILRTIEGVSGAAEVEIYVEPRPDYARRSVRPKRIARSTWSYSWSNELLLVHSDVILERKGDALYGAVRALPDRPHYLSLSYVNGDIGVIPPLGRDADQRMEETAAWWGKWSKSCTYDGPWKDVVLRSALTLKLLTFSLSGAIVAAPTASLPEAIGAGRNWDYRYCWLRDAGLTTRALIGLGYDVEARGFLTWLLHATRLTWPELQVVYDVYGRTNLTEQELDHMDGYRGSRPVRIGNSACRQRQLDAYGHVVLAAAICYEALGGADPKELQTLESLGKVLCRQWREPDSGIWEIRGPGGQYTFSKIMCWVAFDCLLRLHEKGMINLGRQSERYRRERDAIAAMVEEKGFNAKIGSYASEFGGTDVDAALLLIPSLGYREAGDPRVVSTCERIWQRLGRNGLLYRYEPEIDGLEGREGAFGICSFWAVEHLALRGDIDAAEKLFEHLLSYANDVGLFGEEIDPETGAALGNFPQAFTHVGVINAALEIERGRKGKADAG